MVHQSSMSLFHPPYNNSNNQPKVRIFRHSEMWNLGVKWGEGSQRIKKLVCKRFHSLGWLLIRVGCLRETRPGLNRGSAPWICDLEIRSRFNLTICWWSESKLQSYNNHVCLLQKQNYHRFEKLVFTHQTACSQVAGVAPHFSELSCEHQNSV